MKKIFSLTQKILKWFSEIFLKNLIFLTRECLTSQSSVLRHSWGCAKYLGKSQSQLSLTLNKPVTENIRTTIIPFLSCLCTIYLENKISENLNGSLKVPPSHLLKTPPLRKMRVKLQFLDTCLPTLVSPIFSPQTPGIGLKDRPWPYNTIQNNERLDRIT